MSLTKKIVVWLGLLCALVFSAAGNAQMFVVTNKTFGITEMNLIVLRSILLGKSHLTPSGKRVMLVLPAEEDVLRRICESVGVNQWQVATSWSRQVYSEGNRMIYASDPPAIIKYLHENGGGIAVVESPDPQFAADKSLVIVRVEE